ncbi:hypothetical protein NM208_g754 [Fusarium decemcellulare]|uniref:Uncharacterized protein n=1 Tax=Fusarium decemcellulare TaxID=57161 RepID=A0ACC1SYN5_9HYPO|nr:hypothetical protein NM208_g754 [Fusarium decemcellulare]
MQADSKPGETTAPIQNVSFSCKFCQALLESAEVVRKFNTTNTQIDYEALFTKDESRTWAVKQEDINNGCQRHAEFYDACTCVHIAADTPILTTNLTFSKGKLKMTERHGDENDEEKQSTWTKDELLLVNESSLKPGLGLGRVLDREFIDPALIRQWKEACLEHHSNKCSEKITRLNHPLLYLIDTRDMCLVKATDDMAYAALSYVWGQTPMLKTGRGNVDKLQEKGSLVQFSEQLPATIQDAIKLVPLVGERYLWIDSLCIVQDDEVSVRLQIDQMAAIYEKAVLTIVAAKGADATAGLPGVRGISKPRQLPSHLRLTPETCIAIRQDTHHFGPWSLRGWTLQEDIFSRRKIIFTANTVKWVCRSSMFCEDVDSPHDAPAKILYVGSIEELYSGNPFDLSLDVPDMSILCYLISNYSGRYLTYDEDVVPAFSSTFGAMQKAFPRGFIYGLPVSFFDFALLWRFLPTPLSRRRGTRKEAVCPPSWTWAGWSGQINGCSWSSRTYIKNEKFRWDRSYWEAFQVMPLLTWSTKETKESPSIPIPFQNEYHDYKARFMGAEHDLPPGWKLQEPDCQVTATELLTYYYYEHDSHPGIKFWYPVPIGSADAGEEHKHIQYGRYLCANTHRARIWGAKPRFDKSKVGMKSVESELEVPIPMFGIDLAVSVVLRNAEGEDVGELCVDMRGDLEPFWNDDQPPISIELVALSRGLHFLHPQPAEMETWSFYNVLWVEWEDGITYRKGVGRVRRSAWEGLEKEEISLILGITANLLKTECAHAWQREPSPTATSQQTSNMSEVRNALLPDSLISMDDGKKYWEGIDADVNGMLGGIPSVTRIDLQASRTFLARLGIGVKTGRKKVPRALEGGAGIGRVTEGLLLLVAEQVDVIEPVAKFTAVLEGKAGVGSIFNVGLEGWSPEEGSQYFERCKAALNPEGVIVIKENLSTSNIDEFDEVDSSVTRKDEKFLALFEQAGLKLVKSDMQRGFPLVDGRPLMPVKMYALKPEA